MRNRQPRHLANILGFVGFLGFVALGLAASTSCDDAMRAGDPSDTDAQAADREDREADAPSADEAGPPSTDPSDYPLPGSPTPGSVGPCTFEVSRYSTCELTIEGPGFLSLASWPSPPDDLEGEADLFARRALVSLRSGHGLVGARGEPLLGYRAGPDGTLATTLGELPVPVLHPPRATSEVWISLNLDADSPISSIGVDLDNLSWTASHTSTVTVFDTLGEAHQVELYFTMTAPNEWIWTAVATESALLGNGSDALVVLASGTLSFDGHGILSAETGGATTVTFFGGAPQELVFHFGEDLSEDAGSQGTTQLASPDWNIGESQDGFGPGHATLLTVGWDGWLCVVYSNGVESCPGRLAVALFESPAHLFEVGPGLWVSTDASGPARPGPALTEGRGGIAGAIVPPSL